MTQLHDTIRQVEVFGFHFARLDVREHAARHGEAIAEVLSALGVHEAYGSLGPGERLSLLAREIAERRPLIPSDLSALLARHAGGDRDVPRPRRPAAAGGTRARSSPTWSRAPRSPRTCSRCCC